MRRAAVISRYPLALPRGWAIVGLALVSWGLVLMGSQAAAALFAFISSSL